MCQICIVVENTPINENPVRSIEISAVNGFVVARMSPAIADEMMCPLHKAMVDEIIDVLSRDPEVTKNIEEVNKGVEIPLENQNDQVTRFDREGK